MIQKTQAYTNIGEAVTLPATDGRGMLRLVLEEGGPGTCLFAITNACNARCEFCSFSRETGGSRSFVGTEAAHRAIDRLSSRNVRYLVITGGEPLMHPGASKIVGHAAERGLKVIVVTNGALLTKERIEEMADGGLAGLIISIDAAVSDVHETHRGLPGVCTRIDNANKIMKRLGLSSTASVTMSRLVDYEALPAFLSSLGFSAVTFSYPLTDLKSSFLGYASSPMVSYGDQELIEAFEKVKRLKKTFTVVNPTPSLEEMQRFVRGEPQRFPCLAGYKYFYLDWNLDLWRCHKWEKPLCSIFEFDGSQTVRDGCTRCMIDCYRDSSVMHHVGIALHDAYESLRALKLRAAARALLNGSVAGSLRAVIEEFSWIRGL